MRKLLIATFLSVLFSLSSFADFESDTTPVDMRDFWPESTYLVQNYRNKDDVFRFKRVTKAVDPMNYWLPAPPAGTVRFSREDYYPPYYGSETAYYHSSWSISKKADKSVWEHADSWPDSSYCTNYCNPGPGQYYTNNGIVQGRPGGHTLGEGYYSIYGETAYRTPNRVSITPQYNGNIRVFSVVKMLSKHNTFAPVYGRKNGTWGYGNGKTYTNVVRMLFSHGWTANGGGDEIECECEYPSGISHQSGYTSFWQVIWYAEGVGEVQRATLFDERYCDGYMIGPDPYWVDYIDEDH